MGKTKVKRPIFIIGCPRSGTGIFQNLMRFHPDLSFVTPATDNVFGFLSNNKINMKTPKTLLRLLDWYVKNSDDQFVPERFRPYDGVIKGDGFPIAVEPPGIWTVIDEELKKDYLSEEDVIEDHSIFLKKVVSFHNHYFKTDRFLNKRPKDSLRIRYINHIFPDSIFIHLIRDGRAVSNSIYNRKVEANKDWFGAEPPGWKEIQDRAPIAQCAWQWKEILKIIENDSNKVLDDSRYLKVRYEDMTENPVKTMNHVFRFCDLDPKGGMKKISNYSDILESRNYKWKKQLSKKQKEILIPFIEEYLKRHGYLE